MKTFHAELCVILITQITLKEIYNVLLVDNNYWRFRFLSFKLVFDLVACKDRMNFSFYLGSLSCSHSLFADL